MAGTLNALGLLTVIAVRIVVLLGYGRFPLPQRVVAGDIVWICVWGAAQRMPHFVLQLWTLRNLPVVRRSSLLLV